jgi:hypothetical protein
MFYLSLKKELANDTPKGEYEFIFCILRMGQVKKICIKKWIRNYHWHCRQGIDESAI